MSNHYKKFLRLLEKWPVDKTKQGRDLGQHLRTSLEQILGGKNIVAVNNPKLDKQFQSLENLANNIYQQKYPPKRKNSRTMLLRRCPSFFPQRYFSNVLPNLQKECGKKLHVPVMANETIEYLKPNDNRVIIDMTFGAGGHTRRILEESKTVKVIALDRDPFAYKLAKQMEEEFPGRVFPILGRFSELPTLLTQMRIPQNSIDGILFDFGCSSMQFDDHERGFSISKDGPLDMRMDRDRCPDQPTAAQILAKIDERDLAKIIKYYGDEKHAKKIARAIVDARYSVKRIETTRELADLVHATCGGEVRMDKLNRSSHVATKTFQALRIFVNNELNEINYGMVLAERYLKIGGRLITITFHSLEDTIVKRHLVGNIIDDMANPMSLKFTSHMLCHDKAQIDNLLDTNWQQLHKHVIVPRFEEIEDNPRSRSAKFRAALKLK
ncbi:CLUMA_CG018923, isoform A [Clunio marinus]|uniref:CLUMA_CG018923, isoform A n=1 Tax=Clunio marinus TaxID=568069 RepID=A0A1J1J173_9DIPT|nr:CLUMA_CG018923, isoform A [Clunio marinus]